jgi:hypothetical protein
MEDDRKVGTVIAEELVRQDFFDACAASVTEFFARTKRAKIPIRHKRHK